MQVAGEAGDLGMNFSFEIRLSDVTRLRHLPDQLSSVSINSASTSP
jgi:hypothetical protein